MATQHHSTEPAATGLGQRLFNPIDRRLFLRYSGLTVATTGLLLAGCDDDDDTPTNQEVVDPANDPNASGAVNFGTGDFRVLNYAYALEQLEAAFYERVVSNFYSGISSEERDILTDIRDHEVAHRDFFKKALGTNAIGALEPNFTSINFSSRDSVLTTARTFEDLGVSAYNGAGKYLTDPNFLLAAGKIVSVEARHAAIIRDLLKPKAKGEGAFAGDDVVNAQGLDVAMEPRAVIAAADKYIRTNLNTNTLPG
ncbi:ferritin-like domain-containing protein [Hymenobacter sp. 15J16-1T3B]|uniref:ferritin-like domain-containing protein n=1 Tax=Hymenobacter sp. 15J16-1T3B TaxID=2886941 RepID=UPI001D11F046|nr:ferritin-like domain-containing protein [Hymenobacter sp. 15J16-1T3B]MCC3159247.1 ferritin-like domain-containing protein [Hymenobacter sp. 15J16-1T3B]